MAQGAAKGIDVAGQLRAWAKCKAQQREADDLFDDENDLFPPSGGEYLWSLS